MNSFKEIENALLNEKPVSEEDLKLYITDLQKKVKIAQKENDLVKRFGNTIVLKEKLAIMEEAHKHNLCQKIYTKGWCHLCKNSRCMECLSGMSCFSCYTNYCRNQLQIYRDKLKDSQQYDCRYPLGGCYSCVQCLTKHVEEFETKYDLHNKGLCDCKPRFHKKLLDS
jgi:hypothetical protein